MAGNVSERPVIGIDLGTTQSTVGVWQYNRVHIIATFPSCVSFPEPWLDGPAATDPVNTTTIYDVKRMIGWSFEDVFAKKNDIKAWPFKVTQGPGHRPIVVFAHNADEKNFSAEQLSSMILIKLRETAQDYLGTTAKLGAVITVPACFNDCQRHSTFDAAVNAGLEVLGIISEPCAAALAYGLVHEGQSGKNVLFFDLGGGKFEVSMVRIDNGIVKVKATCGEAQLGGIDFDNRMVLSFANEFLKKNNKDILQNVRALRKLRLASQAAKISLSTEEKHTISIMSLYEGLDFTTTVTRADFEAWFEDIFQRCVQLVNTCVKDSVGEKSSVDEILLLGSSSGMPKLKSMLKNDFGNEIYITSNGSSHLVAYGATIQAASLSGQHNVEERKLMVMDFYPLSFLLEAKAVSGISSRETLAYKHQFYKFFEVKSIPAEYKIPFQTILDNQHSILIKVTWYHHHRVNSRTEFELSGIPPAKEGGLEITLFFDINDNGILNVHGVVNVKASVKVPDSNRFKRFMSKLTKRKNKYCSGAEDNIEGNGQITLTCVKRWFPQEDMKSVEDAHIKRVKANKSLKAYVYEKKDLFQDYRVVSLFEEITTSKKIEDAINETSKWLDDHGRAEAEDCTKKMMELNSCIWWATLRDYALKMKKRMDDEENIDDSDKAGLVSKLDYVLEWLERYPSAEGEKIADQRTYIEDLHQSILAKTALKRYISVLATQTSDDSGEYAGIRQQIEEALVWIENPNTPAATYEAEHKKLQRNFNSVTAKSLLRKYASEMFLKSSSCLVINDTNKIRAACEDALKIVEEEHGAAATLFEEKRRELEVVCKNILAPNELLSYLFDTIALLKSMKVNPEEASVIKIQDVLHQGIQWVYKRIDAKAQAHEFEKKKSEVEDTCKPLLEICRASASRSED